MRNLKVYIWAGIVLVLAILLGASMFAPHGADLEREAGIAVRESYLNPEGTGIVLHAEESALQLTAEPHAWTFTVDQAGTYYLNVGYLPLGSDGRELDMIFLLDGKPACDEAVTLTRIWTDDGNFRYTAAGDEIRPTQQEANV